MRDVCRRNVQQRANLGRCRAPKREFAAACLTVSLLVALVARPAAVGPGQACAQAVAHAGIEVSPDALLARGIAHSSGSDMRLGLEELREAVAKRPDHALSRISLASALLRFGLFMQAEKEYETVLGAGVGEALASGRRSHASLPPDVDANALLGLATSIHQQGTRFREAERLYRAHAELVGPLSEEAAKPYMRLHELADESGAEWLDADAELAKAQAVSEDLRLLQLLPPFADPREIPELEPYVRPVELSPARVDTAVEYDSIPALARWVAPPDSSEVAAAVIAGLLQLEILVGEDGAALEVQPVPPAAGHDLSPLLSAVDSWRFTPAVSGDEAIEAWVLFGDVSRDKWSTVEDEAGVEEAAGEEDPSEEDEPEGAAEPVDPE